MRKVADMSMDEKDDLLSLVEDWVERYQAGLLDPADGFLLIAGALKYPSFSIVYGTEDIHVA